MRQQSLWAEPGRQESNSRSIFSFEEIHCSYSNKVIHSHVIIQTKQHIPVFEKTVPCEPFGIQAAQCDRIIRNCPDTFKTNSWNEAYWKSKLFCQKIGLEHGNYQVQSQNCKCSLIWSNHHHLIWEKNDRPGDDGTLRIVKLLVFLLGVIDLASASA